MPRDSAGNYSLPPGYLAVTGQTVLASQHNPPLEDLGAAMTASMPRDGRAPLLGNLPMNGYRATGAGNAVDPQDLVTLSQVQALLASVQGIPTGALIPLTGMVVPAAWVIANGQALLRATFQTFWTWVQASGNLAATEGAKTAGQYGPGDGSTTFTVPNLYADNGYFIRPISSGRTIGTVQADENKSHTHTGITSTDGQHSHGYTSPALNSFFGGGPNSGYVSSTPDNTLQAGSHSHTLTIDAVGGVEARPKNIAYPVLIKT